MSLLIRMSNVMSGTHPCVFAEAVRVQGPGLHQEVHRPELAAEARQDGARGGLLCQQEAQGQRVRPGPGEEVPGDGAGRVLPPHDSDDTQQQWKWLAQDQNRGNILVQFHNRLQE